jgi:hypothetical protein
MPSEMPGNRSAINVETAAGAKSHDYTNGPSLKKRLLRESWRAQDENQTNTKPETEIHWTPLFPRSIF